MKQQATACLLVASILLVGCDPEQSLASTAPSVPTETSMPPTETPAPAETPIPPSDTPAPEPTETTLPANVVFIDAPESVAQGFASLDVQYVFYANKSVGISEFNHLNGMEIFLALNDIPDRSSLDEIFDDVKILTEAGGITMKISLQNNLDFYEDQLLEHKNYVGMMVSSVADFYGFSERDDVVQLIFQ